MGEISENSHQKKFTENYYYLDTQIETTGVENVQVNPVNWKPGTILLDEYKVEKLLGTGGASKVFLVSRLHSGNLLAMKVPIISFKAGSLRQQLFFREIRTWIDLPFHPNLTSCRTFKTIQDRIAIFAEYVPGPSLDECVIKETLVKLDKIIDVAIQVAWGLDAAHKSGVVHQDIKPANIILRHDGVAKLTDFGLAHAHELSEFPSPLKQNNTKYSTNPSISRGIMTPSYCSLEQKNRTKLDHRSDMWSFGLTVLTLFAGPTWWENGAEGCSILDRYIKVSPRKPYPELPEKMEYIIRRCLQPNPDDRFKDMDEVADQLIDLYQWELKKTYPRKRPVYRSHSQSLFKISSTPLSYRSPENWLKNAVELNPHLKPKINLQDIESIKSRDSELLFHLEILEDAYRLYLHAFSSGRIELLRDLSYLLLTISETHLAADNLPGALNSVDRAILPLETHHQTQNLTGLLADLYARKGLILARQSHFSDALKLHDRAIGLCEDALQSNSGQNIPIRLANLHISKARTAGHAGKFMQSVDLANTATDICEKYRSAFRDDDYKLVIANCHNCKANALQSIGYLERALDAYSNAESLYNTISKNDTTRSHGKLAILSLNRARALNLLGFPDEALEHIDRAMNLLQEQIRKFNRTELIRELAIGCQHQASAYAAKKDMESALNSINQCIEYRENLYHRTGMQEMAYDLGVAYCEKGRIQSQRSAFSNALELFEKADTLFEIRIHETQEIQDIFYRGKCLGYAAHTRLKTGQIKKGLQTIEQALTLMNQVVVDYQRSEYLGDLCILKIQKVQLLSMDQPVNLKEIKELLNNTVPDLEKELNRTHRIDLKESFEAVKNQDF